MTSARRVVFLDRDGVVTVPIAREGKGFAIRFLSDLVFYSDAQDSVRRLREAGFDVVIVTNQPDLANELIDEEELELIHAKVMATLDVTRIRTCPHALVDGCDCRKPLPGMLLLEADFEPVNFDESWMVGDRDGDIMAGAAVGCRTVFIDRGWLAETGLGATAVVMSLAAAVDTILGPCC